MDFRRPLRVVTPTLDGDVLAVLAGAEEEFTGRGLHAVLGRGSEHGVRKAADRLVEQGIVLRRRAGRAYLYRLNRDHLAAAPLESLASLRTRLIAGLREQVAGWSPPPRFVLLFGSVARGEARPDSDLDLLVIRPPDIPEDSPIWRAQVEGLEETATAWTGNDARVVEYGEVDLGERDVRKLVEVALKDGVDLWGDKWGLGALLEAPR